MQYNIHAYFKLIINVDTTRPQRELEENGQNYWFIDREQMEHDIREHQYLEYGEHNGNIYGTSLESIRDVINDGKMCVLDCSPVVCIQSFFLINYLCITSCEIF